MDDFVSIKPAAFTLSGPVLSTQFRLDHLRAHDHFLNPSQWKIKSLTPMAKVGECANQCAIVASTNNINAKLRLWNVMSTNRREIMEGEESMHSFFLHSMSCGNGHRVCLLPSISCAANHLWCYCPYTPWSQIVQHLLSRSHTAPLQLHFPICHNWLQLSHSHHMLKKCGLLFSDVSNHFSTCASFFHNIFVKLFICSWCSHQVSIKSCLKFNKRK